MRGFAVSSVRVKQREADDRGNKESPPASQRLLRSASSSPVDEALCPSSIQSCFESSLVELSAFYTDRTLSNYANKV